MDKNIQCRTRERKDKSKYTICYEPKKKPTQNKKADNNIMKKQPSTPKARKRPEEATPPPRLLQLEATAGTPRRARIPEGRPPNLDAQRKAIDRLALAATGELDLLARETNMEIDKIFSAPAPKPKKKSRFKSKAEKEQFMKLKARAEKEGLSIKEYIKKQEEGVRATLAKRKKK